MARNRNRRDSQLHPFNAATIEGGSRRPRRAHEILTECVMLTSDNSKSVRKVCDCQVNQPEIRWEVEKEANWEQGKKKEKIQRCETDLPTFATSVLRNAWRNWAAIESVVSPRRAHTMVQTHTNSTNSIFSHEQKQKRCQLLWDTLGWGWVASRLLAAQEQPPTHQSSLPGPPRRFHLCHLHRIEAQLKG